MTVAIEARSGARHRRISTPHRTHRIPDNVVAVGLADQLRRHVGPGWFAVVIYADGRGVALGQADDTPTPPEEVIQWMAERAVMLNVELHEDGHWIVAWAPQTREPILLWRDADGDLHLCTEIAVHDERNPRGIDAYDGPRVYEIAAEALSTVRELHMQAAVTSRQQVKLAQGGEALAQRMTLAQRAALGRA